MPYDRPTLTSLREQVLQDISSAQITNNSGTLLVALLQKSVLRTLAYAQAGMSYEHYGYLDWIAQQAVPWTATDEFLDAWAALKGVYREAATATVGTVTLAGPASGVTFPSGGTITRSDGTLFTITAGGTTGSNDQVTVTITAQTAGSAGNFDSGTSFTLSTPIEGFQSQSVASAQTTAGTDVETDSSLRTRMLAAYAAPPQGGDRQDYIEWALAVPGVTRAWIAPLGMGAGTVNLYVMFDVAEAAHSGFPQGTNGVATNESRATAATGDQLTVANAIFAPADGVSGQPVGALVYVTAPTAQPINFTVSNLGTNNTSTVQAQITAALQDMFLRLANVGGTVDPSDGSAWPAIQPSAWYAAIDAIGISGYDVTAPTAPITSTGGQLPTLGTITFNT